MDQRDRIPSIILDVDFLSDPKIQSLIAREGAEAIACYLKIITTLPNEAEVSLRADIAECLGISIGVSRERFSKILETCVTLGLLVREGDEISSERTTKESERFREKRDNWRKGRQSSSRGVGEESEKSGGSLGQESEDEDKEEEDKDLKENGQPKPKAAIADQITFPPKWGKQAFAAFCRWQAYREEIKKPLKFRSYQAQVDGFAEDPRKFAALVDRAIRNGWRGLNENIPFEHQPTVFIKENAAPPRPQPPMVTPEHLRPDFKRGDPNSPEATEAREKLRAKFGASGLDTNGAHETPEEVRAIIQRDLAP